MDDSVVFVPDPPLAVFERALSRNDSVEPRKDEWGAVAERCACDPWRKISAVVSSAWSDGVRRHLSVCDGGTPSFHREAATIRFVRSAAERVLNRSGLGTYLGRVSRR